MTDPKELIAEAMAVENDWTLGPGEMRELASRLAAALEEATVPEGWRVTEYGKAGGWRVAENDLLHLWYGHNRKLNIRNDKGHPTARAAMAALDTQKAPPLPTAEE